MEVVLVVGHSSIGWTFGIHMTKVGPGEIWEGTASIDEIGQAPLTFYVDCPPDTPGFPEDISLIADEDETQDAGGAIYIDARVPEFGLESVLIIALILPILLVIRKKVMRVSRVNAIS